MPYTIYDLLRHLVESANWGEPTEDTDHKGEALRLVDDLEKRNALDGGNRSQAPKSPYPRQDA